MTDEEHSHSPRTMTDEYLWSLDVGWLMDLAGDCPVEPADETVCDACAAYLIAQRKEDEKKKAECKHYLVEHDADHFFCTLCGERVVLKTKTGHIIIPEEMERWITEAEAGYDTTKLKDRDRD